MLFLIAETHDILHSGAVVPTAIEDDDFACGRKMLQVTLHVKLTFLAVRWRWKSHDAEYTRADTLCDRFDCATLSGSIAAFKHEDDAQPFLLHPLLEPAELDLKFA